MASKKIYKHHERTTIAAAKTDAQTREIVAGSGSKEVVYTWNDGSFTSLSNFHYNVKDYGAKGDGATDDTAAILAAVAAAEAVSGGIVFFPRGTYRYGTTIALTGVAGQSNGVSLIGEGLFTSILQYTGVGDGITMGGNVNGITLSDFRLYSTTGRDAISITAGVATDIPDAGVMLLRRLDIRGWGRHAIKGRLTVNVRTEMLQVVLNGGCGLYVENANPYLATTWVDTGSWFHENGGHGIALKGTFTYTFSGTISDSNTGLSTDVDTISCAGYTLIGGGTWTPCVEADIGKSVTQGGITVGTLAHYDNTDQHMIINCTTIPSGTGALAITTGTGASTTSTFRKNNHGLYAARSAYININGGHFENHLFGIFLDAVYDSYIAPGYILTQGTGAFGFYAAGACARIKVPILGVDVQSGGTAAAYRGPLTRGVNWYQPGAYTTVDRAENGITIDTQNAAHTIQTIKSTGQTPFVVSGSNATEVFHRIVNTSLTGHAGYEMSANGVTKRMYLDQTTGDLHFVSAGFIRNVGFLGSDLVRSDQRLYWATSDGQKTWEAGSATAQMTGSDVGADFSIVGHDDAGLNAYTAFLINRAGRWVEIPAGKGVATARLPGVVYTAHTETGNTGAGESTIWTHTLNANMLARDGDSIRVTFGGIMATNANNKKLRFYFGAALGLNTGSGIALNSAEWNVVVNVMRTSATTQKITAVWNSNSPDNKNQAQRTSATETLSGSIIVKATGDATATNDMICDLVRIEWLPAGQ